VYILYWSHLFDIFPIPFLLFGRKFYYVFPAPSFFCLLYVLFTIYKLLFSFHIKSTIISVGIFTARALKGIVQRDVTGVEIGLK
jgi:hypothetical protein